VRILPDRGQVVEDDPNEATKLLPVILPSVVKMTFMIPEYDDLLKVPVTDPAEMGLPCSSVMDKQLALVHENS